MNTRETCICNPFILRPIVEGVREKVVNPEYEHILKIANPGDTLHLPVIFDDKPFVVDYRLTRMDRSGIYGIPIGVQY